MARIVSELNAVDGLRTLQSCECSPSGESYIHFWYGSWEQASRLVFGQIVPALEAAGVSTTRRGGGIQWKHADYENWIQCGGPSLHYS
jgi:hypothetical protein